MGIGLLLLFVGALIYIFGAEGTYKFIPPFIQQQKLNASQVISNAINTAGGSVSNFK